MKFDVIIIGGGAAGLSAGLWCDDLGLNALLLESENEFGGQLLWTHNAIENHLGIKAENGRELCGIFLKQTEQRRFIRHLQSRVAEIDLKKKSVFLENGNEFSAKALIVATGVRRRKLNIEGENEFINRGILRSGKLDKDSVEGKIVVIAGGGDAALENALILAESAAKVILIHRRREFRARPEFIEQAEKTANVEIMFDSVLEKISGNQKIETVKVQNLKTKKKSVLPTDAVLVRIGVQPNTEFLQGNLELDAKGYIKINDLCQTNIENIFAVGDVANPVSPTVSSAVGMGATAVKAVFSRLK